MSSELFELVPTNQPNHKFSFGWLLLVRDNHVLICECQMNQFKARHEALNNQSLPLIHQLLFMTTTTKHAVPAAVGIFYFIAI